MTAVIATGCGGGSDKSSSDEPSGTAKSSTSASATNSASASPTAAAKPTCVAASEVSSALGAPLTLVGGGPNGDKSLFKCLYRAPQQKARFVDIEVTRNVNEQYFDTIANSFKSIEGNEGADAGIGSKSAIWDAGSRVTLLAYDDGTLVRASTGLITGHRAQLADLASKTLSGS